MVELTKSIFYHVPKTGGSWVTAVLEQGCTVISNNHEHSPTENLRNDLVEALRLAGEPIKLGIIDTIERQNIGDYVPEITDYERNLIAESEAAIIKKYYVQENTD